jgi:hypothetical protein
VVVCFSYKIVLNTFLFSLSLFEVVPWEHHR